VRALLERFADAVRRRPRAVLAVLGGASLALAAAAPFTRWDSDPELIALEGSPELRAYRDYLSRFGSDELIVVAFERTDLLEPPGLAQVRSLTEALRELPGVESVSSLDTAYRVEFGPFGPFASPLVPDALEDAPPAAELKAALRALPMTRDAMLDASGTVTTLAIQPRARALGAEERSLQRDVLEGALAVLARPEYRGTEFHLAGSPVFNRELERLNARDNALFTPVAFAVVALLLASIGLYGVLAFFVSQRTHEIGVRMSLGADTRAVVRLVLSRAAVIIAVGLAVGLAGALAGGRLLAQLLYGVTATDGPTLAAVCTALVLVSLAASAVPAWRAGRINPVRALRNE